MSSKVCFVCGIEKPFLDFYKHPSKKDGHLGKCKDCCKAQEKERMAEKRKDPVFVEWFTNMSRQRAAQKEYRKRYIPPGTEARRYSNELYKKAFPEKYAARVKAAGCKPKNKGNHLHHWSYNDAHFLDLIELSPKHHKKAHRFLIYDQERKMYRRSDTNELLDTKDRHELFIKNCIETKPD